MASPSQKKQKDEACEEALDHYYNSTVLTTRGGKEHEDHKIDQYEKAFGHRSY